MDWWHRSHGGRRRVLVGFALLVAASPPIGAQTPPAAPPPPAAPAPAPQAVDSGAVRRLGRKYPAPMPPPQMQTGETPRAHVSVVTPEPSPVHQKIGKKGADGSVVKEQADAPAAPGTPPDTDPENTDDEFVGDAPE